MREVTYSKVIVAVRGGGLARAGAETLVERCAAAGAVRVQLNIDDDPVSGAMRIDELDPAIDAVVTYWAGDVDAVLPAVTQSAEGPFAAWEVTARAPLDPDLPADGTRIDALSNIAFLRRPAELDREEWLRRWLEDHTRVAIDTQATFGYVQNIVQRALTGDTPRVDAIVEELFPMAAVTDIHAFYGSDGDQTELERRMTLMLNSVARFGADRHLDVVPTSRYDFDLSAGGLRRLNRETR
ncbi:EthD domain-containing protein [Gordonia amicalis]|uniref:EthD domain-containing protein n=1 Tax=Gordonia TaxID=2053 RepID=UPI0004239840|nr:hypothetical protein CNO18_23065 [Gordonia sp. 1D]